MQLPLNSYGYCEPLARSPTPIPLPPPLPSLVATVVEVDLNVGRILTDIGMSTLSHRPRHPEQGMTVTWSGPSKALQAHLDLFARVDRAHTWITRHPTATLTDLVHAPVTLRQRLSLMTSMADTLGVTVIDHDGQTVGTQRDQPGAVFSQHNLARAVGLVNHEWNVLNEAETHYVSHNIMSTVRAAAEQCGDEPLFPTDLPCPNGLIVFEYPLTIPDLHPKPANHARTGDAGPGDRLAPQTVHARNPDTGDLDTYDGIFYDLYTDQES